METTGLVCLRPLDLALLVGVRERLRKGAKAGTRVAADLEGGGLIAGGLVAGGLVVEVVDFGVVGRNVGSEGVERTVGLVGREVAATLRLVAWSGIMGTARITSPKGPSGLSGMFTHG